MLTRFEDYCGDDPVISESRTEQEANRRKKEFESAGMTVLYMGRKFIPDVKGGLYENIYGVFPSFKRPRCRVGDVVESCGKVYIVIATSEELLDSYERCPRLLMRRMDDPDEPAVYATDDLVKLVGHRAIFGASPLRIGERAEPKDSSEPKNPSASDGIKKRRRRRKRTSGTKEPNTEHPEDGKSAPPQHLSEDADSDSSDNYQEEWIMTEDGFVLRE